MDKERLQVLRHSTAHVMAQAVKELYPDVRLGIGPPTEDGFYYDFDGDLGEDDLPKIEEKMREIIRKDLPFRREEVSKEEAKRIFEERGEIYKLELLKEIPDDRVSLYWQGSFVDLCRGPHVESTGQIKAFKLLSVAGAYWRGDERNKMLKRIYGTAFYTEEELQQYLARLEEAKKRDHRRLGKELELFSFHEEVGAGFVIWHHKGVILRWILEEFEKREHLKRGYQFVLGPQLSKLELWNQSGHYDFYRDHMFFTEIEGQKYALKPMNCIGHILVYKTRHRSWRELPLRFFELGRVHRFERSGVLHGLLRVREFTQDDAHIFCRPDQLEEEIRGVLHFVQETMDLFGFSYEAELSTKPEEAIGTEESWERATEALRNVLEKEGIPYEINEGEGAFYGPKIDIKLEDALGRKWQCATIQCDFSLPERFDLSYIAQDGSRQRPVMIHRVILGALERFIGILIEHYGGAFPLWLAPEQVRVISLTSRNIPYAETVLYKLKEAGIRTEGDFRNETLGYKIRQARLEKVPYMLIVGEKEEREGLVAVRSREKGELGTLRLEAFIEEILPQCQIPSLKGGGGRV